MFTPYRKLFATPGGIRFSIPGLIARMPISMTLLAVTLVIVAETHKYTLAGFVSTGAAIITSVISPMWSRLADQYGQRALLRINIPLHMFFGLTFLFVITRHGPEWLWMSAIFLCEFFMVNIGGMVRRRWLYAIGEDRTLINTAYSYEALVDEIIFITGPLIASIAATLIAPAAGILFAFAFMSIGTFFFVRERTTEPPPHPKVDGVKHGSVLKQQELQAVALPFIFLGAFFSSTQLAVVGYTQQHHQSVYLGVVLALWAAGSGVAALFNGAIHWKISDADKFKRLMHLIFIVSLPFLVVHSVWQLGIALFISGFGVAPLIVAGYGVAEKSASSARITETLAWVIAALSFGGALPGPISGYLIDNYGAKAALVVPIGALVLANFALLPYIRVWRRIQHH